MRMPAMQLKKVIRQKSDKERGGQCLSKVKIIPDHTGFIKGIDKLVFGMWYLD